MIRVCGVTTRFGDQTVLDRLDLDLAPGTVTALMGPNGSGKTTLGRLLLGLIRPDDGEIRGLAGLSRAAVFQEDRLCEQLTAAENVRLVLDRSRRTAAVEEQLLRLGLDATTLAKPVRDLSGGQRRRVAIARALVVGADLLVLDEPFTGLDASGRLAVTDEVREHCAGRTTLLVTHDPADVERFGATLVRLSPPRAPSRPDVGGHAPSATTSPGTGRARGRPRAPRAPAGSP